MNRQMVFSGFAHHGPSGSYNRCEYPVCDVKHNQNFCGGSTEYLCILQRHNFVPVLYKHLNSALCCMNSL